jgi:CRP-like cAMP-binding protein
MATSTNGEFDPKAFLASVGAGRSITEPRDGEIIFSQGDPADALFYIQEGKVQSHHSLKSRKGGRGRDPWCWRFLR